MKKICFSAIALFISALAANAQPNSKYFEYVENARTSFDKKEYKRSAASYATAFRSNAGKAYLEDRYNAALSWTFAGNKDSAFVQLFKVVKLYDYINYNQLSKEPGFGPLHDDKRWDELTGLVKLNISRSDSKLNRAIVVLLDSVYRDHHSYRMAEVSIRNEFGAESKEMEAIRKKIRMKDSVNLAIVESVLNKYGWLGRDVAGFIGNYAIVLIIQHADLATQKKYLPVARDAFEEGNVDPYDMALLEDKVALREGKNQLYGSVIVNVKNRNFIAPVEAPEELNKRREAFGLKPMNTYLMSWGMKWDVAKYKKDLLLLEKEKIEY